MLFGWAFFFLIPCKANCLIEGAIIYVTQIEIEHGYWLFLDDVEQTGKQFARYINFAIHQYQSTRNDKLQSL